MILFFVLLILIFLSIGSFLNVLAYRITFDKSLFRARSHCNLCDATIAWYDNIPLLSWILLRARCRYCKTKISFLYPFVELLTAVVLILIFFKVFSVNFASKEFFEGIQIFNLHKQFAFDFNVHNILKFLSNTIFFSSLIVATRTDFEAMVIPQCFSLWLVPFGILFSYFDLTMTTFWGSVFGAILGYGILWSVATIFKKLTGRNGLGEGDMDLLALIGAFLGPVGVWLTLMLASFVGLFCGVLYILFSKKNIQAKIPFGPFLALGAFLYFMFDKLIFRILFF